MPRQTTTYKKRVAALAKARRILAEKRRMENGHSTIPTDEQVREYFEAKAQKLEARAEQYRQIATDL